MEKHSTQRCLCCGRTRSTDEMQIRVDWNTNAQKEPFDVPLYFCSPACLDVAATNNALGVADRVTHDDVPIGYTCLRVLQQLNDLIDRIDMSMEGGLLPVHRITLHFPRPAKLIR